MKRLSVIELYQYFLAEIRKEYTGTVIPSVFNITMRDALQEWKRKLASELDAGSYAMAEQSGLRVITDGSRNGDSNLNYPRIVIETVSSNPYIVFGNRISNGRFYMKSPSKNEGNLTIFSTDKGEWNTVSLPTGLVNNVSTYSMFPSLFRVLNVHLAYSKTDEMEIPCLKMSSAEQTDILNNSYRKPSDLKSYYTMADHWLFFAPLNVSAISVKLDYLREPFELYFDETLPADATIGSNLSIVYPATGNPKVYPYTPGYGSININVSEEAKREIVHLAVQTYLKNVNDPRYQAYLQETMMRRKG